MEYVPVLFMILGIVAVAVVIIPIMFACGWRPDVDEEKKAFKRAPASFHKLVFATPFILFGFMLCAMGISKNIAILITFCLAFLVIGVLWLRSYKKMKQEIKKLGNELTSKWKDKETNK